MAKKNVRDDPSKTQVTENPQMSDIVLVLDKMELLIQAVSEINKNGKYSTVPADKEHQNSFLKIDRYATFFENFLKNFWSQLKDPTHFGLRWLRRIRQRIYQWLNCQAACRYLSEKKVWTNSLIRIMMHLTLRQ